MQPSNPYTWNELNLSVEDIRSVKAHDAYSIIETLSGKTHLLCYHLKRIEELCSFNLIRLSRSLAIPLSSIKQVYYQYQPAKYASNHYRLFVVSKSAKTYSVAVRRETTVLEALQTDRNVLRSFAMDQRNKQQQQPKKPVRRRFKVK